jgi:hypothetical protein
MSQRFCISNLCADSEPCCSPQNAPPDFASAKLFLPALALNHFRCGKQGMLYLLAVRGAHGSSDQRGLGNGADVQIGGGVRVGDAFQAIVG